MIEEWIPWLFEGIVLAATTMILFGRSVFHAGLNLLIVVLCIGVLFGLYGAEFLFISQIMLYGGGIIVLILFATMVIAKKELTNTETTNSLSIPTLLAAVGAMVIITVWVMANQPQGVPYVISTSTLGKKLILEYSLPLEVAGILLLISLIGAVLSSIQKPTQP